MKYIKWPSRLKFMDQALRQPRMSSWNGLKATNSTKTVFVRILLMKIKFHKQLYSLFFLDTAVIDYDAVRTFSDLGQIGTGLLDFASLDLPLHDPDSRWLQVPIAGAAVVPAYHISSLSNNNNNESLVLDGETLALIFMGNITTWDHPSIQLLNPTLTLPHANITIAVTGGEAALGQTDVFKKALCLFSGQFARELAEVAGNDLAKMRPATEGRAFIAVDATARHNFVKVRSMLIYVGKATKTINKYCGG